MKIRKIKVHNLYSYDDAEFELDDYNVIVGPNGAGKTNLVRILNLLLKNGKPLDKIELDRTQRLKPDEDSYLLLTLELTKQEIKMILQLLFYDNINSNNIELNVDDNIEKALKNFTIGLRWPLPLVDKEIPTLVCGFDNSKFLFIDHNNTLSNIPTGNYTVKDEYINTKFDKLIIFKDTNIIKDNVKNIERDVYPNGIKGLDRYEKDERVKEDPLLKPIIKQISSLQTQVSSTIINSGSVHITYSTDYKKMLDSINMPELLGTSLSLFEFINKFICKHINILQQPRLHKELLGKIKQLRNVLNYTKYIELCKYMKEFFNVKMEIMPLKEGEDDNIFIKPLEVNTQKYFKLEDSASGYADMLNILLTILGSKDSTIILDEPALNLHPSKIKQLANKFEDLVKDYGNQVILITHSPYFISYEIVNKNSKANLIYVRKDNGISKSVNINVDEIGIKPHLFKPEIFFSTCTIIVEGSSDRAVLQAISDNFNNILENNDIVIIYVDGKKSIKPYEKILKDVIPYVVMKDKDNDDKNEDNNTIQVEHELEDELCGLYDRIEDSELKNELSNIWKYENGKIKETQAYEFIDTLMKRKAIIKDSKFWQVIKKALCKAKNKDEKEIDELLEKYFK